MRVTLSDQDTGTPIDEPTAEQVVAFLDLEAKRVLGEQLGKFFAKHAGHKLRLTVPPLFSTAPIRIETVDQSDAIEGVVVGNVFRPV